MDGAVLRRPVPNRFRPKTPMNISGAKLDPPPVRNLAPVRIKPHKPVPPPPPPPPRKVKMPEEPLPIFKPKPLAGNAPGSLSSARSLLLPSLPHGAPLWHRVDDVELEKDISAAAAAEAAVPGQEPTAATRFFDTGRSEPVAEPAAHPSPAGPADSNAAPGGRLPSMSAESQADNMASSSAAPGAPLGDRQKSTGRSFFRSTVPESAAPAGGEDGTDDGCATVTDGSAPAAAAEEAADAAPAAAPAGDGTAGGSSQPQPGARLESRLPQQARQKANHRWPTTFATKVDLSFSMVVSRTELKAREKPKVEDGPREMTPNTRAATEARLMASAAAQITEMAAAPSAAGFVVTCHRAHNDLTAAEEMETGEGTAADFLVQAGLGATLADKLNAFVKSSAAALAGCVTLGQAAMFRGGSGEEGEAGGLAAWCEEEGGAATEKAVGAVVGALAHHEANAEVCRAALRTTTVFCTTTVGCIAFGNSNGVAAALAAMKTHSADPTMLYDAAETLRRASAVPENERLFMQTDVFEALLVVLVTYGRSQRQGLLAETVLGALANIATLIHRARGAAPSVTGGELAYCDHPIMDLPSLECYVSVMTAQARKWQVQAVGCFLVWLLCFLPGGGSVVGLGGRMHTVPEALAAVGAGQAIVYAMQANPGVVSIAEDGVRTLAELAKLKGGPESLLGMGAARAVGAVMEAFDGHDDPGGRSNLMVQQPGCAILAKLACLGRDGRAAAAGAIPPLLAAAAAFPTAVELMCSATAALRHLAGSDSHRGLLVVKGAPTTVLATLHLAAEQRSVAEDGCACLALLDGSELARQKMLAAEPAAAMLKCLAAHGEAAPGLVHHACQVLCSLSAAQPDAAAQLALWGPFAEGGGPAVLMRIIAAHYASHSLSLVGACKALAACSSVPALGQAAWADPAFVELGSTTLIAALKEHFDCNAAAAEALFWALGAAARCSWDFAASICLSDGAYRIIDTMREHGLNPAVFAAGLSALSGLSQYEETHGLLRRAGIVKARPAHTPAPASQCAQICAP